MCVFRTMAAVLLGLFAQVSLVQAATIKISFNVVSVDLWFDDLYADSYLDGSEETDGLGEIARGTEEHAAYTAAHHPLKEVIGKRGRITLKIEEGDFEDATVSCVRGFLCNLDDGDFMGSFNSPGASFDRVVTSGRVTEEKFSNSGFWILGLDIFYPLRGPGTGTLFGANDGRFGNEDGRDFDFNGKRFSWDEPLADFQLANVNRRILPVPLPAGALLLCSGLLALGLTRRRLLKDRRPT